MVINYILEKLFLTFIVSIIIITIFFINLLNFNNIITIITSLILLSILILLLLSIIPIKKEIRRKDTGVELNIIGPFGRRRNILINEYKLYTKHKIIVIFPGGFFIILNKDNYVLYMSYEKDKKEKRIYLSSLYPLYLFQFPIFKEKDLDNISNHLKKKIIYKKPSLF